jgi:hypothetical protein
MTTYIVTLRVEADDDITPDQVRNEIYDAAEDVSFGFDVTSVAEEA